MTRLWTSSAVRTGRAQQGLLCQLVRCAATDPSSKATQHGFNQAIRKRAPRLQQSQRKFTNHLSHAVLDSLGVDAKTLKGYIDSLLECQTRIDYFRIDEARDVLEATLAQVAEEVPVRKPHTVLSSHCPCRGRRSYGSIARWLAGWKLGQGAGLVCV